jgi:hypothetical protein
LAAAEERGRNPLAEGFVELAQGLEGADFLEEAAEFPEGFAAESGEERSGWGHAQRVYILPMSGQEKSAPKAKKSAAGLPALRARFEACRAELATLGWLSEGSVSEGHPGTWRWTRKVKAKTVTVALSAAQAEAFRRAIVTHRRLEELIRELRALSQTCLLQTTPARRAAAAKKHPRLP